MRGHEDQGKSYNNISTKTNFSIENYFSALKETQIKASQELCHFASASSINNQRSVASLSDSSRPAQSSQSALNLLLIHANALSIFSPLLVFFFRLAKTFFPSQEWARRRILCCRLFPVGLEIELRGKSEFVFL